MPPRPVMPGRFYPITRRCTQRQFLLRPDPGTNNAFLHGLMHAAQRSEVDVLLPCAMSNHYHVVSYDRAGRVACESAVKAFCIPSNRNAES